MSVVDWTQYPEPWRSIGREWAREVKFLAAGHPEVPFLPKSEFEARRKEFGWTTRQLAELIGCLPTTIRDIELGRIQHSRYEAKLRECLTMPPSSAS